MNENFLNKRFNLTEKTAAKNSPGDKAGEKVANYLDRIEKISQKERGLEHLKERYINHSLVDISGDNLEKLAINLYKSEKRIAEEEGRGGDISNEISDKDLEDYKKEILKKREYQKESLERILDYVIQNEDNHPKWFRYFILRSIQKMGELKADEKKFTNRTETTLAPFLVLNHEAVGFVREILEKMLEKQFELKSIQLDEKEIEKLKDIEDKKEYKKEKRKALKEKKEEKIKDIFSELNLDENLSQELLKKLEKKSFDELYAFAITEVTKNIEHFTTKGRWEEFKQFEQDDLKDPKDLENLEKLVKSLRNKGTGWCTASGSATRHLKGGDFYVYYTYTPEEWEKKQKGEKVKPSQPGIAIRMLNGEVYEVRGTEPDQNLSPELVEIAREKYKKLLGGDKFEKKRDDMNKLTKIYSRFEKDEEGKLISTEVELSKEEISFLYELNDKIKGFGYKRDPRIEEILNLRNKKKDLEKIYGEGRVAFKSEEINENTRYFGGDLNEEHLDILRNKINNPFYLKGDLYLNSLTTAEGLTLPEKIDGYLVLDSLTTAEGLTLPENVGGTLFLWNLATAEGLTLPENVGGYLYLDNLSLEELNKLAERYPKHREKILSEHNIQGKK